MIGADAENNQIFNSEVAQHVLDVGGIEDAASGFGDHDIVGLRANCVDHFSFPRAFGEKEIGYLVVKAAVTAIQRIGFNGGVDNLQASGPRGSL